MRILELQAIPVRAPYRRRERSASVDTGGVSNLLVERSGDDGLGWGECATAASMASIVAGLECARPFIVGRDPWHGAAIARDVLIRGRSRHQPMTVCFALAGVGIALWDLCGKACGLPVAEAPDWGLIDGPGLGVRVNEEKVMAHHDDDLRHGEYPRAAPNR